MTGEMVRVPRGAASILYKSLLASCKLQFPNQVTIKNNNRSDKNDDRNSAMSSIHVAGVRAQIERAERMFADLLNRLEHGELPTTKSDWMLFIDAGASVLELYSTLANGFNHGGAKVAQAYSVAISTTGKFDPTKLWKVMERRALKPSFPTALV